MLNSALNHDMNSLLASGFEPRWKFSVFLLSVRLCCLLRHAFSFSFPPPCCARDRRVAEVISNLLESFFPFRHVDLSERTLSEPLGEDRVSIYAYILMDCTRFINEEWYCPRRYSDCRCPRRILRTYLR